MHNKIQAKYFVTFDLTFGSGKATKVKNNPSPSVPNSKLKSQNPFDPIILTLGSPVMILNASLTWLAVAPPPTSRKLAGEPPCSLMMSMVAMARPAPFTMQPMSPSRAM